MAQSHTKIILNHDKIILKKQVKYRTLCCSKTLDSKNSQKPSSVKRETSVKDRRDGPIEMPDIDKPGDHKKRAIFRFKSLEEVGQETAV